MTSLRWSIREEVNWHTDAHCLLIKTASQAQVTGTDRHSTALRYGRDQREDIRPGAAGWLMWHHRLAKVAVRCGRGMPTLSKSETSFDIPPKYDWIIARKNITFNSPKKIFSVAACGLQPKKKKMFSLISYWYVWKKAEKQKTLDIQCGGFSVKTGWMCASRTQATEAWICPRSNESWFWFLKYLLSCY